MSYIREAFQDLQAAVAAFAAKWQERRHLRAGGNPDVIPF